jgi:hypothetical protein
LDLSKLTTLKALTTLFIEGNNLTSIDFSNIKAILPNLKLFGISENPWPCRFLSTLLASLHANTIEVYHLVVEKTTSNVEGIACSESEKANDEDKSLSVKSIKHQLLNDDNEMRAISEKFEVVSRHVNESSQRFVTKTELINEINMLKNLLASLKQEKHHNGSITINDIKRVANDTMAKASTLEKSDYDEKINGLNVKLESVERSIDEIRNQLKALSRKIPEPDADGKQQFSKIQSPPTSNGYDSAMKLMITVIFVIVCGFTIIYITKLVSRRNSRKFVVRRACSTSDTLNENIL